MEDEHRQPLLILMDGDRQVSTQALARAIGVKRVTPCDPKVADKHSGYQVGGTLPFGTRRAMPVYYEQSIAELPRIYNLHQRRQARLYPLAGHGRSAARAPADPG